MIVICPNCGTRYKMPDDMVLAGKRMRCAECEHRWTLPAPEEDEELAAAQAELRASPVGPGDASATEADVDAVAAPDAGADAQVAAESDAQPEEDEEEAPARNWLAWGVALVVAAAFGLLAGGVWMERLDPARVPLIGGALAGLQPAPSALAIKAEARLTKMESGLLLLDVQGEIVNGGGRPKALAPLKASLAGPNGVVRRWNIAPPVAQLAPGAQVSFSSTLTDVPPGAQQLRITGG